MIQVKIFGDVTYYLLEDLINQWLRENPNALIKEIKYNMDATIGGEDFFSALILYEI